MKKSIIAVIIVAIFGLFMFLFKKNRGSGDFATLSEAVEFAESFPEYPSIDNEDWWDPNFSSFYRTKDPTFFSKVLRDLGLKRNTWSIKVFNQLLDDVAEKREKDGYFGRFIQKMKPTSGKKFAIWGNVQGAFHSLIRDLKELHERGVISNNFEIVNPEYYFIFTGNVIDRSAYSMETLTLVLQLLKKNPDHVFYLRGTHEDKEMWHNFGLKRELSIRASGEEEYLTIPYGKKFNRLFNTLPLALYLTSGHDEEHVNVVRITNDGADSHELNEKEYAGFLYDKDEDPNTIFTFKLTDEMLSQKDVKINAIIKSNHVNQKYYRNDGLRLLLPEKEATTWAVLSAPTGTYRRLFGFFYDSFTVLTTADRLQDWTLSLYGQDVREMTGFKLQRVVGLTSGVRIKKDNKEEKLKEQDESILVGSTMDLSRGLHRMSEQLREGLMMPLKEQNEKGGIKNRRINLVVKNDFYVPSRARQNIESFLKEAITIIICPQGTANLQNYLDLIEQKKLLVLFPAGVPDKTLEYLIRFGPSFKAEGRVLTSYAIKQLGLRRFSFFYQNDKFGLDAMDGAKEALKDFGIIAFNEVQYERNDLEFADQVEQVKKFDQDAIVFFGIPAAVEEFIRQVGIEDIAHDHLLGISDLSTSGMKNFLEGKGLSMMVSSLVPNPKVSKLPIVEQYRSAFDTLQLPYNEGSLKGYLCSSILIEALKKVTYPFDLKEVVKVLENLNNYELGGFLLNFNSETRELSNNLWLHRVPDDDQVEWDTYDLINEKLIRAKKSD